MPIGPNPILSEQRGLIQTRPKKQKVPIPVTRISPVVITADMKENTLPPGTWEKLYNLIEGAYMESTRPLIPLNQH